MSLLSSLTHLVCYFSNFFRDWDDYKYGFGNLTGEYWIGNENLHFLTNQGNYRSVIDIEIIRFVRKCL